MTGRDNDGDHRITSCMNLVFEYCNYIEPQGNGNQWLLWRNTYPRVLLRGNKSHDSTGRSCHVMEQFLFIFRFTNLVLPRSLQKDNEAHQSTIEKWCKYIRKMHQINQRFPLNINSLFCVFFVVFCFSLKRHDLNLQHWDPYIISSHQKMALV